MRKVQKITCTIELTEGAEDRLTKAFVDLYYGIKEGRYKGPLPEDKEKTEPEQV